MNTYIKELISKMTLEEKASLCSGADNWRTKEIQRLGIPSISLVDGPHGLRKQERKTDHLGINDSKKAICFPAACATASSFDIDLMNRLGQILGEECIFEEVNVLLGPAVNIKRTPLCGRNFEYLSEDPYLAGMMAAAYIRGVQSKGVGTSLKHFALNNQETNRMTISSEVSERVIREIYLPAFEIAIKEAKPRSIMCSYNRVNGEYVSESQKFLTEILREGWNYDGCVVSDWGAVNDRVKGLSVGLDLEMPSSGGYNDKQIVNAVKEGRIDEGVLNKSVENILNLVFDNNNYRNFQDGFDMEKAHRIAEDIETECAILLENNGILPLKEGIRVAYLGEFAQNPRYQGGGSSHVHSYKVVSAIDAANDKNRSFVYEKGFSVVDNEMKESDLKKACQVASESDVAVIFAGLPEIMESEGYDRTSMELPALQNKLIEEVLKVQSNVVVVLHNGSPIEMPWASKVSAILEMYLGGQGVGEACDRILYGEANPSGRLAESFPYRLQDNPSYLHFPGNDKRVYYGEGIFVGYRYYDTKNVPVRYAFGHGLSYTEFEYSDLKFSTDKMSDNERLTISLKVKNIGKVAGKEVIQLYIAPNCGKIKRPLKELKGFKKIHLLPSEEREVFMEISARDLSYFDEDMQDWYAPSGEYQVLIGHASDDIRLKDTIEFCNNKKQNLHVDFTTTFGQILDNDKTAPIIIGLLTPLIDAVESAENMSEEYKKLGEKVIREMPLKSFLGQIPGEQLERLIYQLNSVLIDT